MTDTTDTTNTEPADVETTDTDGGNPNREAAKWRTKLRETETALTAMQERVTAMQRAEVERLASEHLADGSDVFKLGDIELANVLNETGDVDADAVTTVAQGIVESRPGLRRAGMIDHTPAGDGRPATAAPSWSDLFSIK